MIRTVSSLAVVLTFGAALVSSLRADIATPRPQWTTVQMESEVVDISLGQDRVQVRATFHMVNHGADGDVAVGYPLGIFEESLNEFAVTIDGQAIKNVRTEAGRGDSDLPASMRPQGAAGAEAYRFDGPYKQWKICSVPMKAGGKHIVTVSYWVKPAVVKDAEKGTLSFYTYILRTGATWQGKINEAIVHVALDGVLPASIVSTSPAGQQTSPGKDVLTWAFHDFKPTENIEIVYRPSAGSPTAARQ
jgi:hypothetical protein